MIFQQYQALILFLVSFLTVLDFQELISSCHPEAISATVAAEEQAFPTRFIQELLFTV